MHQNTVTAKNTVAGLGFRASASVESLRSALQVAMAASQSAAGTTLVLTALATAEDKAHHPALTQLAAEMAVPVVAVPLAQLTVADGAIDALSATHRVTSSAHFPQRYGARSLAECAALTAAGTGAYLLAPRSVSADQMATAAIAENSTL